MAYQLDVLDTMIFKIKNKGFTIVELMLVIVIIVILASITVVAYHGIQDKAYVAKSAAAADSFTKLAGIYALKNEGFLPAISNSNEVCIGSIEDYPATNDFDEGQCIAGNYGSVYIDDDFNQDISRYGSIPNGSLPAINFGDYRIRGVVYQSDGDKDGYVIYYLKGEDQECPKGDSYYDWSDRNGDLTYCEIPITTSSNGGEGGIL